MIRTPRPLKRLVVVGATVAAAASGMSALSMQAANAVTQPVTGNAITPTSDSETATNIVAPVGTNPNGSGTGDNLTCNPFLLQTTPTQIAQLAVQITQAAVQNSTPPSAGPGQTGGNGANGKDPSTQIGFCDPTDFVQNNNGQGGTTTNVSYPPETANTGGPTGSGGGANSGTVYQNTAGVRGPATNPNSGGSSYTVKGGGLDNYYCPAVFYATSNNPTAHCTGYFTTDTHGQVEIGVTSNEPGPMTVTVFADTNDNAVPDSNASEHPASAAKTWVANVPSAIDCTPKDSTDPTYHQHAFQCRITTSAGTGAIGQNMAMQFQQPSDPDYGSGVADQVNAVCGENDETQTQTTNFGNPSLGQYGVYDCTYNNDGQEGTDHISAFDDVNGNAASDTGEPNENLTKTWITAAPDNSFLTVSCADNAYSPVDNQTIVPCENQPSSKSVTVTAHLTASQGGPNLAGKIVNFVQCDWFGDEFSRYGNGSNGGNGPYDGALDGCYDDSIGSFGNNSSSLTDDYHANQDSFSPVYDDGEAEGFGVATIGQCTTGSNGTCQATLTHGIDNEGDFTYILGFVGVLPPGTSGSFNNGDAGDFCYPDSSNNGDCYYLSQDNVFKVWHTTNDFSNECQPNGGNVRDGARPADVTTDCQYVDEDRNVTLTPTTTNQTAGGDIRFVAHVTDRFGNDAPGTCVGFTLQGTGRFTNATTADQDCGSHSNAGPTRFTFDNTCITNVSGRCSVETTSNSNEHGGEVVTASILTDYTAFGYLQSNGQTVTTAECKAAAGLTYFENTYPSSNGYGTYGDSSSDRDESADGAVVRGDLLGLPSAPVGNCTSSNTVQYGATGSSLSKPHITSVSPQHHRAGRVVHVHGTGTPGSLINVVTFDHHHGTVAHHNATHVGSGGHWSWTFQPNYTTIVGATATAGGHTTKLSNTKTAHVHQVLTIKSDALSKHSHGKYYYVLRGHSITHIAGEKIRVMHHHKTIGSARMTKHGNFQVHYHLSSKKANVTLALYGNGKDRNGTRYADASGHEPF